MFKSHAKRRIVRILLLTIVGAILFVGSGWLAGVIGL